MLSEGIRPIGDGLLEVAAERLQGLLVSDDINDIYDVEQTPFARGKFAAVRRAVHKKTGVHYAAKFLRRRRRAQCTLKEIGHEIAILMLCADSKHIVKLNSVHETRSETALLLELATGGELQAILDEEGALTEAQAQICMREILRALQYLHKKCVAHLDLKPQNILLCGEKVEDGLKLCDFGISRIVEEGGKVREILGTPDYVAPEVLQYEPLSLKTDIWSVGVLAYVLLTGMSPFGGDTKQETFLNISKCALTFPEELFEDVSPMAIDFIKCALRVKSNDRMTASECLEHRWLNDELPLRLVTPTNHITDCNDFLDKPLKSSAHSLNEMNHSKIIFEAVTEPTELIDSTTSNKSDKDFNNKENILIKSNKIAQLITSASVAVASVASAAAASAMAAPLSPPQSTTIPQSTTTTAPQSTAATTTTTTTSTQSSTTTQLLTNGIFLLDEIINEELSLTTVGDLCESGTKHQSSSPCLSLFPDAPTTPKVCRKSTPDSPPSVKALVKKFQLDNQEQGVKVNGGGGGGGTTNGTSNGTTSNGDGEVINEEDYCTARCGGVSCVPCGGPGCRHLNGGRKPLVIDQGIIC